MTMKDKLQNSLEHMVRQGIAAKEAIDQYWVDPNQESSLTERIAPEIMDVILPPQSTGMPGLDQEIEHETQLRAYLLMKGYTAVPSVSIDQNRKLIENEMPKGRVDKVLHALELAILPQAKTAIIKKAEALAAWEKTIADKESVIESKEWNLNIDRRNLEKEKADLKTKESSQRNDIEKERLKILANAKEQADAIIKNALDKSTEIQKSISDSMTAALEPLRSEEQRLRKSIDNLKTLEAQLLQNPELATYAQTDATKIKHERIHEFHEATLTITAWIDTLAQCYTNLAPDTLRMCINVIQLLYTEVYSKLADLEKELGTATTRSLCAQLYSTLRKADATKVCTLVLPDTQILHFNQSVRKSLYNIVGECRNIDKEARHFELIFEDIINKKPEDTTIDELIMACKAIEPACVKKK